MTKQTDTSNCCGSTVHIYSGDEGTNHYICDKCGEPCDLGQTDTELDDMLIEVRHGRMSNTKAKEAILALKQQWQLEARIDELEKTIEHAPTAKYEGVEGIVYNAKHPNHRYMLARIAKLTQSQNKK